MSNSYSPPAYGVPSGPAIMTLLWGRGNEGQGQPKSYTEYGESRHVHNIVPRLVDAHEDTRRKAGRQRGLLPGDVQGVATPAGGALSLLDLLVVVVVAVVESFTGANPPAGVVEGDVPERQSFAYLDVPALSRIL